MTLFTQQRALYTVPGIVDSVLDRMDWPDGARRLIDTSCGDGAFLGRAVTRLLNVRSDISATDLMHLVAGWEIHPDAAHQARERIAGVLYGHGWRLAEAQQASLRMIRNADFLTDGPQAGERYHCITGNPPYLRKLNLPDTLRQLYEGCIPDYAQAGILQSFLDRAADLLTADGQIALVTADRWLFNSSAARLRTALGRQLAIGHLTRLDALTSFYRPKHRRAGTSAAHSSRRGASASARQGRSRLGRDSRVSGRRQLGPIEPHAER